MSSGALYLIPSIIADNTQQSVIPPQVVSVLPSIHFFLAEDIRTARRYLSSLRVYSSIEYLHFEVLDKNTSPAQVDQLLAPLKSGENVGVLSESGCPGVADPGAIAVAYAHKHGIKVVPLVGPSSLLLALMASGLNGQRFAFHGYLPIDAKDRAQAIKDSEKESRQKNQTQLFIETPYRNQAVWNDLLKNLQDNTLLTLAYDITGLAERIQTKPVREWKKEAVTLDKLPCVFLLLS